MNISSHEAVRPADAVLFPSGHIFAVLNSPALLDSLRGELAARGVAPSEVLRFSGEMGARVIETGWCAVRTHPIPFAVYGNPARRLMEAYAGAAREGRHVVGVPARDALIRHEACDLIRRHVGQLVGYFSPGGVIELFDA